ncbi:MAG: transporter [Rhodospirillales bacterium]|nr:transporter [Rhodospirillales bacterium]
MDALSEAGYRNIAVGGAAVPAWRYWTLFLLVTMATFSMVDKMAIGVLLDPIKHDFDLSDKQLGLLTGIAFSLFFAVAGIPLGIVADRGNRRNLIAICITIWSMATAACGLTTGLGQLLSLRLIVGAGESGATPSAVSMISDLFPARERAKALAIYYLFTPIGSGIGLTVGAILVTAYGWRTTLIMAGLPGLLIVVILLLTVKEPRRLNTHGHLDHSAAAPPFREALKFIATQRSLLHICAAITLVTIAVNAFGMWMYPFFTRVDHIPPAAAGWQISLATFPASGIGMILVGIIADRLARRDERWRVWIPAMLAFSCFPLAVAAISAKNPVVGLAFTGVWMVGGTAWYGASYAACQTLVHPRMRATISSILLLLTTLLGFGIGPLLTGAISDFFAPSVGVMSVGYGMVGANLLALWGGVHFLLAARSLRHDLRVVSGSPSPSNGRPAYQR